MAPGVLKDIAEGQSNGQASSITGKKHLDASALATKFAAYRCLVPLLSDPNVVFLNASYAPPSNLIVHDAITKYSYEALHLPHPKPQWQAAAEDVRALLARYINTEPSNIAFTRDTTEGLNYFMRSLKLSPGDNVVILDTEHPNQAYGWLALRSAGIEVRQVATIAEAERTGVTAATAETFAPYVDERTRAIGLSSIMFHSGQRNDVAGVCAAFRPRGVHVLLDATQQAGFAALDVRALGVSAAAFSLHKGLACPTGLACLYVDPDVVRALDAVPPPVVGAGAVRGLRADLLAPADPVAYHPSALRFSHLNVSLVGAAAAKAFLTFYLDSLGPADVEDYLYSLGDLLRGECARLGISVVGPSDRKGHAPHLYILRILDPAWDGFLRGKGVYTTPYRLGMRVSLGFYNNSSDIKRLAEALEQGIAQGLGFS